MSEPDPTTVAAPTDDCSIDGPAPDPDAGGVWGVAEVRRWRAEHDPLVVPDDAQGGVGFAPDHLRTAAVEARAERAADTPTDERIGRATWPEVALWCMVASTNAKYALSPRFVSIYTVACDHYTDAEGIDAPLPVDVSVSDEDREAADELRTRIRETQNRHFVAEEYDGLPIDGGAVPKVRFRGGDGR